MPDIGAFFTATIKDQIAPEISDAILDSNEYLKWLKSKNCFEFGFGGDGFSSRVRKTESTIGGATSDWGTRTFSTTQPFGSVDFTYRQYSWPLSINNWQTMRNKNADGYAKLFNMMAEQVNEVMQSASTRIGRHLYRGNTDTLTGDEGTPIDGLADIITGSTGTYAGINRATAGNEYWRAQTSTVAKFTADTDSIGVNDGVDAMQDLWMACSKGYKDGGSVLDATAAEKSEPDGIFTGPDIFQAYKNSLAPQVRYSGKEAVDADIEIRFRMKPMYWDNVCPSTKMHFVNSKFIKVRSVGDKLIEFLMEQDQANPFAHIWLIGGQFQHYSKNPRYHGTLTVTSI